MGLRSDDLEILDPKEVYAMMALDPWIDSFKDDPAIVEPSSPSRPLVSRCTVIRRGSVRSRISVPYRWASQRPFTSVALPKIASMRWCRSVPLQ